MWVVLQSKKWKATWFTMPEKFKCRYRKLIILLFVEPKARWNRTQKPLVNKGVDGKNGCSTNSEKQLRTEVNSATNITNQ